MKHPDSIPLKQSWCALNADNVTIYFPSVDDRKYLIAAESIKACLWQLQFSITALYLDVVV